MKRFTLFIASVCVCVSLFAGNDTIRILGIGNSFTMDAMEDHLQPIMSSMNQPATMAYPYRGGTTLQQHDSWKNRTDTMPYNYYEWYKEEFFVGGDRSANLITSVEKRPWDYIVIQTDHAQAGKLASYDPYLTRLISFIKSHCSNKDVKIGLYMTWAYDSISTYSGFARYKYNTQIMYDSIINAVSKVMQNHKEDIDFLIPVGTAIQNARTSFKGHTMNRDGYHLNYDHGRYIASLAWASVIGGFDPDSVPFYPENISEYCANMCRAAVKGAIKLPYDTTSLRKEFGKSESGSEATDESRLERVTFNGLSVPIIEGQYEYTVKINTALTGKVAMYSFPLNRKCEQNIINEAGADIKRDPKKYGYFPLDAPQKGQTVTYVNRVIATDLKHVTTYTFHLVGATEQDLVYTISSLDDLKDFAQAVNGGQYSLKAELTRDINLDIQKQNCWKTPIGTIAHPYTGTFDGKGYMLENFNIYSNGDSALWQMTSLGLFGAIKGATIKNLTLTSREHDECYFTKPSNGVTSLKACGVLVGWMANSTISRCNLDVNVYSTMKCPTGAMVGLEDGSAGRSVIDRCEVKGIWRARQTNYYAAYVGQANNVAISNSSSHVRMPLETNHGAHIAGFIGLAQSSESGRMVTLRNCYFAGSILDRRKEAGVEAELVDAYLGAFVSTAKYANSFMENCYYLDGSCQKVVATYNNHPLKLTATKFVQTNLTDSALIPQLGGAFVQGQDYPVIAEQEAGLVERFSQYNAGGWTGSLSSESERIGDVCDWLAFHSRRKTTDIVATGARATWFAKTSDGYIKTKDVVEGGVKSLSFLWNKYEVDTADLQLTITLGEEKDVVNKAKVPGNPRQETDLEYIHSFTTKENAVLKIANTGAKVIDVGDITIVPYLRYTAKKVTVNMRDYADQAYKFTNSQLIDNTNSEGEIVYSVLSENAASIASVDPATGEVTMLNGGDVTIQAAWNDAKVTTTYQLHILEPYILETFKAYKDSAWTKAPADTVLRQGDYFPWVVSCARRGMQDTLVSGARATWFNASLYGFIHSQDTIEGGIKRISFKWNKASRGERTSALEIAAGDYKDTLQQKVTTDAGVYLHNPDLEYSHLFWAKENVPLSIRQIKDQFHMLLGDIAITPYLYYTTKQDSVELPQASYDCTSSKLLINNTNGEGEVTYEIVADSTKQASMENGVLDLSNVTNNGDIHIKASWNEGRVFTTFTLRVTGGVTPASLSGVLPAGSAGGRVCKVLKKDRLLIIRDQQVYNLIGQQYK